MIDLATRIRIIRNELGISQERLGELAGVSKQAVGQWESGETKNIRNAALFALQRKTRFSAEWIATGRGPQRVADLSDPNIIELCGLFYAHGIVPTKPKLLGRKRASSFLDYYWRACFTLLQAMLRKRHASQPPRHDGSSLENDMYDDQAHCPSIWTIILAATASIAIAAIILVDVLGAAREVGGL